MSSKMCVTHGGFAWTPRGSGGRPSPHLLAPATPKPLLKGPRSHPHCPSWSGPCICGTLAPGWDGGSPSPSPRLNQWHLWQRGGNSLGSSHTPGAPSVAGGASRGPAPITPPVPPRVLRAPGGGRGRGAGGRVWRRKKVLPWRCTWGACCSTESREGRGLRARCGQHPSPRRLRSAGTQADSTASALAAPTHVRVRGPDRGGGPHQPPGTKGQGSWERGGSRVPSQGLWGPHGESRVPAPQAAQPSGRPGPRERTGGRPAVRVQICSGRHPAHACVHTHIRALAHAGRGEPLLWAACPPGTSEPQALDSPTLP